MRKVRSMLVARGWLLLAPFLLAACAAEAPAPEPAAEEAMPAESEAPEPAPDPMPADSGPRVFFISPEDGGSYPAGAPVAFQFGLDSYELGAVPEELVSVRDGVGHHHLGVNTPCLPAGTEIPRGDPEWIHFGDASDNIEMMLEPGEHSFVLQIGDDEHRTQAADGLCASVTIRVEEGL